MLFGHQTDNNATQMPQDPVVEPADKPAPNPLAVDPATGAGLPATADDNMSQTDDLNVPQPDPAALDDMLAEESVTPVPASLEPAAHEEPAVSEATAPSDDLLSLKQQALGELAPLVDHLEQSPEEKFRTTMMMIQSTDNATLIKEAYAAAQAIPDEKTRAQALLDVINEINYFTQKDKK